MKINAHQLLGLLKALPMIRFALMLGGGTVATISGAMVQFWLLNSDKFPSGEAVWIVRIQGAVCLGLAAWLCIFIVMVTLAFGRAGKLRVRAGGVEADIDFDNTEPKEGA